MGFTIWELRFGIYGLGVTIWDLRFGSYDLGVTIWDLRFGILDLRFWIYEIKKALHILWPSIVNRKSKIAFFISLAYHAGFLLRLLQWPRPHLLPF